MRVQSNGKIRRSEGEWQEIFERFRQSGLSAASFCRREKISKNTFAKWRRKLDAESSLVAQPFVEWVVPTASVESAPVSGELELSLPGGITLRWRA